MDIIKAIDLFCKYAALDNYKADALQIIADLQDSFPNVSLKSEDDFIKWFHGMIKQFVNERIIETKSIKQCGTISEYFARLATKAGFPTFVNYMEGHIDNIVLTKEFPLEIDFSYKQFDFPAHGSLRDFSMDERDSEEYIRMKTLFEEMSIDPIKAVSIKKLNNIPTGIVPARTEDNYITKL